jgi:DNA-binding response OmpR family regulator
VARIVNRYVLKVLIVEDDLMIADMVKSALIDFGFDVCGIARTVPEAIAIARRDTPDLALIDVALAAGGVGTEIAAQLSDLKNLGILYATDDPAKLAGAGGHAHLAKPYREVDLVRALEIVAEIVATGTSAPPFPRGFTVLKKAFALPQTVLAAVS